MSRLKNIVDVFGIKPKFQYEVKDYFASGIITGLPLPENEDFNPLEKIWSSVKKRINEKYGVSTTAIFVITEDAISCSFLLNCAGCDDDSAEHKNYNKKFKETFHLQMMVFEEAITTFLTDIDNGYVAYCDYVENCGKISKRTCESMFDTFLKSSGYKTEKDEKKKAKIRQAVAKTVKH